MLGANAIVGGGPPLVIGAALTAKTLKSDRVAVAFTGDGGSNQGTIFEAMNMAVVLQLPAIFVIENNGYGEGTAVEYAVGAEDLARRAAGFGMPAEKVDGRDFFAMYDAAAGAVTRARAGGGPSFIEARCTRIHGHYCGDPQSYRSKEELTQARELHDPITAFRERVLASGELKVDEIESIDRQAVAEMEAAVTAAHAGRPHRSKRCTPTSTHPIDGSSMAKTSFRQALNDALRAEMRRDSRVVIIGEDVAGGAGGTGDDDAYGGIMGVTRGLVGEFGRTRVIDTPITESAIVGMAAGAAMTGLLPVAELMFVDFLGVCLDQILNQAAKFRYMFGGKARTPLVIRTMFGAGFSAGAQHSQCLYSIFTHIPGSKSSFRQLPTMPKACSYKRSATKTR